MTREQAVEVLTRLEINNFRSRSGKSYLTEALIMAIQALQTERTGKWIPVSERLPEEEEKSYWVCLDDGYQCECRWTNDMYGFGANEWSEWGWHIMDKPQYSRVVAWMPLPEPWKEGE